MDRGKLAVLVVLVVGIVIGLAVRPALFGDSEMTAVTPTTTSDAPEAAQSVRWKMASAYAGSTPIIGPSMKEMLERIRTSSDGSLDIRFFEPGALVPPLEIFDAVASGGVDAGWATPGFWAGKVPALQLFASIPFGPAAPEYMAWMYVGGGQELLDELYLKHNIKSTLCMILPPEASGWFRQEIRTLDDLRGLKMRFFALGARVMEKLDVSTQLLAGGDIYPALELGTIDATEFSSPAIDRNFGFEQIAKFYYFPGWHQQSTWADVIYNLDGWNELSLGQQTLLTMACGDLVQRGLAQGEALQVPALEYFEGQGVQLKRWNDEFLNAYKTAWEQVAIEESEKDADFARALASLNEFRERFAIWRDLGYLD